jgi:hypothetical protein
VRDNIWDSWLGARNVLRLVLGDAGIDPDADGGEVRIAKQWTTEALDLTRSLDTNCSEFIDECSEYIAGLRNHERVEVEDVQCVLDWMESTREVRT